MHHTSLATNLRRRSAVLAIGVSITAALLVPASAAHADTTSAAPASLGQAEDAAATQAASSGQPVTVDAAATPESTLTAQPNGSFLQTVTSEPERLQRGGAWVPLDATLQRNADGSYSPAASTSGLTLSGGGRTPLATLDNSGRQLSLTWPTTLPTPTISGDSALYPDVLPDVDLKVAADEQGGFSETLIVKSAQAAADPALGALTLAASGTGVNVSADTAGNLTAADTTTGTVDFHAAAPLMWDSSTDAAQTSGNTARTATKISPHTEAAAAPDPSTGPAPGAQVASVAVNVTGAGDIRLTPDQDLLTGSDTQYPVYIDPDWVDVTHDSSASTYIQSAYPGTSHYNDTDNNLGVGYQNYQTAYGKERTYYQFNIGTTMGDNTIDYAHLGVTQNYSADWGCASYNVTETNVGHISSATTYNNQPDTYTQTATHAFTGSNNTGCAGTTTGDFDVTGSISSDGDGTVTYLLTGSETNTTAFKRFNKKAELTIQYNTPPNVPTSLSSSPTPIGSTTYGCGGGTYGWVGKNTGITLAAHVSDPDGSKQQHIRGQFAFWDKGGSGTADPDNLISTGDADGNSTTVTGSGPASIVVSPSAHPLKDGHLYGWHVRTDDGIDQSAETDSCYLWYDATAPTGLTVTSAEFPSGTSGTSHTGVQGNFYVSATDPVPSGAHASGLDHFDWSASSSAALAGDGGTHLNPGSGTSTADVQFTPTAWGSTTLWVAAVDKAGNESQPVAYSFYVPDSVGGQVHPGDIDNDDRPDLLAADSATGNLDLIPTTTDIPAGGPVIASRPSDAPVAADGTYTWANTLIAHRSSTTQSPSGNWVDDLWAEKNGHLWLYANTLNTGDLGSNGIRYFASAERTAVIRPPTCASSDCTGYSASWNSVTQLIAPGDVNGDTLPDLITVENGTAWLFLGSTHASSFTAVYHLGAGSWSGSTLIAPGDDNGDPTPDLWVRNDTTGAVNLYPITGNTTTGFTTGTAVQIAAPGAYLATDRPLIASPGDSNGDGYPDLYTVTNTHQLWENPGEAPTTDGTRLAAHALVSTNALWNTVTNIG